MKENEIEVSLMLTLKDDKHHWRADDKHIGRYDLSINIPVKMLEKFNVAYLIEFAMQCAIDDYKASLLPEPAEE